MTDLPQLPGRLSELPPLRPGRTVFHQSEHAEEAYQLLAARFMDYREPASLPFLREMLAIEFPDLQFTDGQLRHFVENFVAEGAAQALSPWMRRGLLKADADLNAVRAISETAENMDRRVRRVEPEVGRVEYTEDGVPIPVGPTEKDYNKMQLNAIRAREAQLEAMARIGMLPEKKAAAIQVATQVNVDLSAIGGSFKRYQSGSGGSGSSASAKEPVDASFRAEEADSTGT